MDFEEWLKTKREEEQQITHGAETVKDSRLYALEKAVIKVCFADKLPFMNLYYIPPALDDGAFGLYGNQRIMISKPYFEEHGLDDDMICTMFHELVHAWDAIKGRKDTDGDFHNAVFKQTCEAHGGTCSFSGQDIGFSKAGLTAESLERIRKEWGKKHELYTY